MLSALPPACKRFRFGQCMDNACQNCPKISIFSPRILHLSSSRREQNLAVYFQFTTLARKITHRMKFKHVWMQKDMKFRNAIILWHFRSGKRQKSDTERHEFWERHNSSLPWARESPNPTAKDMNFVQNCTH